LSGQKTVKGLSSLDLRYNRQSEILAMSLAKKRQN